MPGSILLFCRHERMRTSQVGKPTPLWGRFSNLPVFHQFRSWLSQLRGRRGACSVRADGRPRPRVKVQELLQNPFRALSGPFQGSRAVAIQPRVPDFRRGPWAALQYAFSVHDIPQRRSATTDFAVGWRGQSDTLTPPPDTYPARGCAAQPRVGRFFRPTLGREFFLCVLPCKGCAGPRQPTG